MMNFIQLQIKEIKYNVKIKPSPFSFKTIVSYEVFISKKDTYFVYNFDILRNDIKKHNLTENTIEKIILEKTKSMLESGIEKNVSGIILNDFIEKGLKK